MLSAFGSSEYAKEVLGAVWGYPPDLELEKEAGLQRALVEIAQIEIIDSAHDCSDGGITVALVESGLPVGQFRFVGDLRGSLAGNPAGHLPLAGLELG